MKLLLLLLIAPAVFADAWIAHRYDDQRVLFFFAEHGFEEAVPPGEAIPPPQAQWADAGKITRITPAQLASIKLQPAHTDPQPSRTDLRLRERLQLRIFGALTATVEVKEFVHQASCSSKYIGALARVVTGADAYRAARQKYYIVGELKETGTAWQNTAIRNVELDSAASSTVTGRLNEQLKIALADAGSTTAQWRATDAELAAGQGALTYNVQSVPVGSNGELAYFVRAQWTVQRRIAFLIAVWFTKSFEVRSVDSFGGRALRMPDFAGSNLGLDSLPKIVNVFQFDGSPAVMITSEGLESFGLVLKKYTSAGLQHTGVEWSYGC